MTRSAKRTVQGKIFFLELCFFYASDSTVRWEFLPFCTTAFLLTIVYVTFKGETYYTWCCTYKICLDQDNFSGDFTRQFQAFLSEARETPSSMTSDKPCALPNYTIRSLCVEHRGVIDKSLPLSLSLRPGFNSSKLAIKIKN